MQDRLGLTLMAFSVILIFSGYMFVSTKIGEPWLYIYKWDFHFYGTNDWDPQNETIYGAVGSKYRPTLYKRRFLALLIAIAAFICIAMFITEIVTVKFGYGRPWVLVLRCLTGQFHAILWYVGASVYVSLHL